MGILRFLINISSMTITDKKKTTYYIFTLKMDAQMYYLNKQQGQFSFYVEVQ